MSTIEANSYAKAAPAGFQEVAGLQTVEKQIISGSLFARLNVDVCVEIKN